MIYLINDHLSLRPCLEFMADDDKRNSSRTWSRCTFVFHAKSYANIGINLIREYNYVHVYYQNITTEEFCYEQSPKCIYKFVFSVISVKDSLSTNDVRSEGFQLLHASFIRILKKKTTEFKLKES